MAKERMRDRMTNASRIVVGVASGYLLGRTKKLRLAITIGSMLAGQRIATSPQGLLKQGSELLEKNPELQKLQEQVTEKLFEAAKAAAIATATSRLESLSQSLREQSAKPQDVAGEVLSLLDQPQDSDDQDDDSDESDESDESDDEGSAEDSEDSEGAEGAEDEYEDEGSEDEGSEDEEEGEEEGD